MYRVGRATLHQLMRLRECYSRTTTLPVFAPVNRAAKPAGQDSMPSKNVSSTLILSSFNHLDTSAQDGMVGLGIDGRQETEWE